MFGVFAFPEETVEETRSYITELLAASEPLTGDQLDKYLELIGADK